MSFCVLVQDGHEMSQVVSFPDKFSESLRQRRIESYFLFGGQCLIQLPAHSLPRKSDYSECGNHADTDEPERYVCGQHGFTIPVVKGQSKTTDRTFSSNGERIDTKS